MTDFSWQGILFGIFLVIIGIAITSLHAEPTWLDPGIGLAFISGGIISFVIVIKDN